MKNGTKLKNGSEENPSAVMAVMNSIQHLWEQGIPGITMASDLVQICRGDPAYKKYGDNEERLIELALLQPDGKPHDTVRNVVLSAFSGEGLGLQLSSPVAGE